MENPPPPYAHALENVPGRVTTLTTPVRGDAIACANKIFEIAKRINGSTLEMDTQETLRAVIYGLLQAQGAEGAIINNIKCAACQSVCNDADNLPMKLNGCVHNVCKRCTDGSSTVCPVCRAPYGIAVVNYTLTTICEKLKPVADFPHPTAHTTLPSERTEPANELVSSLLDEIQLVYQWMVDSETRRSLNFGTSPRLRLAMYTLLQSQGHHLSCFQPQPPANDDECDEAGGSGAILSDLDCPVCMTFYHTLLKSAVDENFISVVLQVPDKKRPVIFSCGHSTCWECYMNLRGKCPFCKSTITSCVDNNAVAELCSKLYVETKVERMFRIDIADLRGRATPQMPYVPPTSSAFHGHNMGGSGVLRSRRSRRST